MIDYKNLLKKEFGKSSNDLQKKTFYDYIYRYDYIFIDDITYFAKSEWLDEVVKDLMDHCFNNKKPIPIFTAQCSIQ
jgi:DNA replication protein DnaC